jgi:formylglycine-generating enzyme
MKYNLGFYSFVILLALLSVSCGKKKGAGVSPTTGMPYNDPNYGGFEVKDGAEQETGPGLVFIEGGTFTMGRVEPDNVHFDWNNVPRRVTVSSFYMDETELKNVSYREYLWWLSRVYDALPEVYRKALPDTLVWRKKLAYNEPYLEYYFRHPAYNEYPVVGVNWLQANDFCAWRTDRVNEQILIDKGIMTADPTQKGDNNFNTDAYLAGQYTGQVAQNLKTPDGNDRIVKLEDGILLPKYRLPTEAEWEYAAYGLIGNSIDERVYDRKIYPWNGHNVRRDVKGDRGKMLANFMRGNGDMMGTAGALNDGADITKEVMSYWPNDYGLYCMAGNVSEWVMDVYRPLSAEDVDGFNPFRGNVFTSLDRDKDGNVAPKDSLGHLKFSPVTEAEATKKWRDYSKADYKNFKDGDYTSSVDYTDAAASKGPGSQRMYAQSGSDVTSLINDNVRVYKGGSWKDRAYWLAPGARRFLQEDQSTDDIGFRCAMTRVGAVLGNKR